KPVWRLEQRWRKPIGFECRSRRSRQVRHLLQESRRRQKPTGVRSSAIPSRKTEHFAVGLGFDLPWHSRIDHYGAHRPRKLVDRGRRLLTLSPLDDRAANEEIESGNSRLVTRPNNEDRPVVD